VQALLRRLALQIDEAHCGQVGARHRALRQLELLVAAGLVVVPGLERRRRGAEDDRAGGELRPIDGRVARRVAQPLLLLERGVVLLVDDDQGEPGERRQHGEPRADHDAGFAARRLEPRRGARDVLQAAVQERQAGFGKGLAARLELRA
jgi:hypothetical protein